MKKKIGVLALQGAFHEHITMLNRLGVPSAEVRLPAQLAEVDGLIIPGGESTTIGKLAVIYNLLEPLRHFAQTKPLWGTCAGMIFMAKTVKNQGVDQPLLELMDIEVERNAFGRQIDSFETDLTIAGVADAQHPFHAVFIRAPKLLSVHSPARVLAQLPDGSLVAAQQGGLLVTAFHPELTGDSRLHAYFVQMVEQGAP